MSSARAAAKRSLATCDTASLSATTLKVVQIEHSLCSDSYLRPKVLRVAIIEQRQRLYSVATCIGAEFVRRSGYCIGCVRAAADVLQACAFLCHTDL